MIYRFLFSSLILLLAACQQQPLPPVHTDWAFTGKLGVKSEAHRFNAGVRWQQQGEQFDIQLSGTLGLGAVKITGTSEYITLEEAGEAAISGNPQSLTELHLGYPLPVAELKYWVLGKADPNRQYEWTDKQTLNQSGWLIKIRPDDDGLPRRLDLVKDDTSLRLVIREWQQRPLSAL